METYKQLVEYIALGKYEKLVAIETKDDNLDSVDLQYIENDLPIQEANGKINNYICGILLFTDIEKCEEYCGRLEREFGYSSIPVIYDRKPNVKYVDGDNYIPSNWD